MNEGIARLLRILIFVATIAAVITTWGHISSLFIFFMYTASLAIMLRVFLHDYSYHSGFLKTHYYMKTLSDIENSKIADNSGSGASYQEEPALSMDQRLSKEEAVGYASKFESIPESGQYSVCSTHKIFSSYPIALRFVAFAIVSLFFCVAVISSTNIIGSLRYELQAGAFSTEQVIPVAMFDRHDRLAIETELADYFLSDGRGKSIYVQGTATDIRFFGGQEGKHSSDSFLRNKAPVSAEILNDGVFQTITDYSVIDAPMIAPNLNEFAIRHLREWHKVDSGNFVFKITHVHDVRDYITPPGDRLDGILIEYRTVERGFLTQLLSPDGLSSLFAKYLFAPIIAANNVMEHSYSRRYEVANGSLSDRDQKDRKKALLDFKKDATALRVTGDELIQGPVTRRGIKESLSFVPSFLGSLFGGSWSLEYSEIVRSIESTEENWGSRPQVSKAKLACEAVNLVRGEHGPGRYTCN